MSGARGIPMQAWEAYDEPYKTSYSEYVAIQREKDAGTYSLRAAPERAAFVDNADPAWVSSMQAHYVAVALGETMTGVGEARMACFSKAQGNRNMVVFGMMDENRHSQLQLFFPHANIKRGRQRTGRIKHCAPTSGRPSRRDCCLTTLSPVAMRFRPPSC